MFAAGRVALDSQTVPRAYVIGTATAPQDTTTAGTGAALTFPTGYVVASNDHVVINYIARANAVSLPAGYSLVGAVAGTGGVYLGAFIHKLTVGDTLPTLVQTGGGGFLAWTSVCGGLDLTTPVDATSTYSTSTINAPAITTASNGAIVIRLVGSSVATDYLAPSTTTTYLPFENGNIVASLDVGAVWVAANGGQSISVGNSIHYAGLAGAKPVASFVGSGGGSVAMTYALRPAAPPTTSTVIYPVDSMIQAVGGSGTARNVTLPGGIPADGVWIIVDAGYQSAVAGVPSTVTISGSGWTHTGPINDAGASTAFLDRWMKYAASESTATYTVTYSTDPGFNHSMRVTTWAGADPTLDTASTSNSSGYNNVQIPGITTVSADAMVISTGWGSDAYANKYPTQNPIWPFEVTQDWSSGRFGYFWGQVHTPRIVPAKTIGNFFSPEMGVTSSLKPFVIGAPSFVSAYAEGNGGASVIWAAPASNGGSAITDYLIEYNQNGGGWVAFAHTASTNTSAIVTGLTATASVIFRISAVNAIGTGTASGSSDPVTILGAHNIQHALGPLSVRFRGAQKQVTPFTSPDTRSRPRFNVSSTHASVGTEWDDTAGVVVAEYMWGAVITVVPTVNAPQMFQMFQ